MVTGTGTVAGTEMGMEERAEMVAVPVAEWFLRTQGKTVGNLGEQRGHEERVCLEHSAMLKVEAGNQEQASCGRGCSQRVPCNIGNSTVTVTI
jgi:hypothetical protein